MKFKGPLFFSVLVLTILVAAFYPKADNPRKEAVIMQTVLNFMRQAHYNPKPINDDFSERFYDQYMERIDGNKRYFTQQELKELEQYKTDLDDQVKSLDYTFFNKSLELLEGALDRAQKTYREILSTPFDFTVSESVELDRDKRSFPKNEEDLRDTWRKDLKYETLTRLHRKLERQKEAGEETEVKSMEELEKESREEVLERTDRLFNFLTKYSRVDRLSIYLNSMINLYDPHSLYYEPVEKENFDMDMSGKLEGIGARLQNDGEFTKVFEIMPGGPAWKGKELEKDDIIYKVAQGVDGEWEDVTGLLINPVVQKIRGKPGTTVRLYVKKKDGSFDEISIVRDVVIIEETYAKSLILNDAQQGEKIGYIFLPRFYTDFNDPNGRSCAEDIKAELEKLKEEKVAGVILDLRTNGGGALSDAIEMTGLFIEKGPVVQVKSRIQKSEVLEDEDPGVTYDGPLVVMVNQYSASASEILSAALQDYDRAVIVGSNSTYGKGTVQRIFDMDRFVRSDEEVKPLGAIKVTTQNFYRVDGGSVQLKGVTPDIVLPDYYTYIETGEKDYEYAMEWTQIEPVKHDQNVYNVSGLDDLRTNSEMRIKDNEVFQKILGNAKRIKELRKETSYPIKLSTYQKGEAKREAEAKQYDGLMDDVVITGVYNLKGDMTQINKNDKNKETNKDFMEGVSKDIYINETLKIIHDMIKLK